MKSKGKSKAIIQLNIVLGTTPVSNDKDGRSACGPNCKLHYFYYSIKKELIYMTTTANAPDNGARAALTARNGREPVKLLERIGSATVEVSIHFSNTSKETMEDKILRLIEREVTKDAS